MQARVRINKIGDFVINKVNASATRAFVPLLHQDGNRLRMLFFQGFLDTVLLSRYPPPKS
jgi:hypothetical protein